MSRSFENSTINMQIKLHINLPGKEREDRSSANRFKQSEETYFSLGFGWFWLFYQAQVFLQRHHSIYFKKNAYLSFNDMNIAQRRIHTLLKKNLLLDLFSNIHNGRHHWNFMHFINKFMVAAAVPLAGIFFSIVQKQIRIRRSNFRSLRSQRFIKNC